MGDLTGEVPVDGTPRPPGQSTGPDPDRAATAAADTALPVVPDAGALPTETVGVQGELQFAALSPVDRVQIAEPSPVQVDEIQAVQAETPLPAVDGAAQQVVDGTATGTTGLATLGDAIRVESLGELPVTTTTTTTTTSAGAAAAVDATPVWGLRLSRDAADASGSGVARVQVSYQGLDGGVGGDYGSRLRLTVYPSCVVTTPDVPACQQGVPLDTLNDPVSQTVEATVPFEDAATGDVPITDLSAPPPPATDPTATDPTATAAPTSTPTDPAAPTATVSQAPAATPAVAGAGSARQALVTHPLAARNLGAAAKTAAVSRSATRSSVLRSVVSSSSSVLAVSAAASGPGGTYAATDLKPSGSWSAGGSTGSFTYSYPIPTVPSVGGSAPSLAFEYDSASVDGASTASNSQASWVGRGWDLSTGFIERRYVPCSADGHPSWGDLCWHSPYADKMQASYVVSMPGAQSELILDLNAAPAGQVYRTEQDNGWRFTRTSAGGVDNPDTGNEAWRVQSPDGTVYWFGSSQVTLVGGATQATMSVATVPVYSDSTEPYPGWHTRAYRWYMDKVVDVRENATTYYYSQDVNYYHRASDGSDVQYTLAVYPSRVEYGQQLSEQTATPPARITFGTVGRCLDAAVANPWANQPVCTGSERANPGQYPDVPADLICTGSCSSEQSSPTFFTRRRLSVVNTYARTADNKGYDLVYTTMPAFAFPATADGNDPSLWLDWLQVRGFVGTNVTSPATNFNGTNLRNRVDWNLGLGVKPLDKRRINIVYNDTGGEILVTYHAPSFADACPQGGATSSDFAAWYPNVDGKWDHNHYLCYPVMFDPDGAGGSPAGFGIFHKYVVTAVTLRDLVGGSVDETYKYTYVDSPAWAYHADIIGDLTEADGMPQTWDVFRGYHDVKVQHGSGADSNITETWYFRGMNADHNADGTLKSVSWSDLHEPTANTRTDSRWLAGQEMQTRSWDDDGVHALSTSVYYYVTARTQAGPGVHDAQLARRSTTWTKSRGNQADTNWLETQSTSFWNGYGLQEKVSDSHDLADPNDDQCLDTQYVTKVTAADAATQAYMVLPQEQVTYENPSACSSTSTTSQQGAKVAHTMTFYDGAANFTDNLNVYDANPTGVRVYNKTGTGAAYLQTNSTFDKYGHLKSVATPYQQSQAKATTIGYGMTASGAVGTVTTTDATGATTIATMSRLHTGPDVVQDANGNYTWIDYDAFQRVIEVDKTAPNQPATAKSDRKTASQKMVTYTYPASAGDGLMTNVPPLVQTTTLASGSATSADEKWVNSFTYSDGFGRVRQQQSPVPTGGTTMVLVDYQYDDRGLQTGVSVPTWVNLALGKFVGSDTPGTFYSWTHTDYDALNRPYQAVTSSLGVTQFQSTTDYWTDHTTATSPMGNKTYTYLDGRGRTTKSIQATGSTSSGNVTTSYAYAYTANTGSTVTVTAPPTTAGGAASTTTFTADMAGRRVSVADSDAGTTATSYDPYGRTDTVTTPTGKIKSTYDVLDRLTSQTVQNVAGTTTYQANTFTYDTLTNGKGLPATTTAVTSPGGSQGDVTTTTSVAGYDNYGRPTASTQNVTFATSTGITAINNLPVTNQYGYDAAGHTLTVTHPALGTLPAETVTAGYNTVGLPNTLKTTVGTTSTDIIGGTTYSGSGLLSGRDYGTSAVTGVHRWIGWDVVRRVPTQLVTGYGADTAGAASLWQNVVYHRDDDGAIDYQIDKVDGQAQCYGYDGAHRLTQATTTAPTVDTTGCTAPLAAADTSTTWNVGPGAYRSKWTLGPSGAITSVKNYAISGTTAASTTRIYSYTDTVHPGQLTTVTPSLTGTTGSDTFTYDPAGAATTKVSNPGTATTRTMTTAPNGDLVSLVTSGATTGDARYAYDTSGARTVRITNTAITVYAIATELTLTRTSSTLTGTRRYTLGSVTAATRTSNGGLAYLFDDLQSSNTISIPATGTYSLTTGTRQRYLPYGGLRGQTALSLPTQHAWLDQTSDPDTGLTYLNNRYYDPALARLLAPDPLIAPDQPSALNPYTYANDNPITFADPSGLDIHCDADGNCHGSKPIDGKPPVTTPTPPHRHPHHPTPPVGGDNNGAAGTDAGGDAHENSGSRAADNHGPSAMAWQCGHDPTSPACNVWMHDGSTDSVGETLAGTVIIVGGVACVITGVVVCATAAAEVTADAAAGCSMTGVACGYAAAGGGAKAISALADRGAAESAGGGAARTAARSCLRSFAGNTPVLLADGTKKPIEDVKVGDRVVSTDPETGERVTRKVSRVWVHNDTLTDLKFADGTVLTTTEDHPFWSADDQRFEQADQLAPGERVLGDNGRTVKVLGLRQVTAHQGLAYNLSVEGVHTYHVGGGAVLVHNACGYTPAGGFAESDLDEVAQTVYQHIGAGDIPGRPSFAQIHEALTRGVPEPLEQADGTIAQVINHGGVRVIINEESPWRSTAYFPGR